LEIFNIQHLKLTSEQENFIPKNILGIDIGQTLTKFAYVDTNELLLVVKPTAPTIDETINIILKSNFNRIHFTGGRAFNIFKKYSEKYESILLDEFEANVKGIDFLYNLKKKQEDSAVLIVSIGTGTSIVLKHKSLEHLGGSAMGGGMFMGLIKLIYNLDDYNTIIQLANKGNRYNVDLRVSDIYVEDDFRVKDYFRAFTAASLGKINDDRFTSPLPKEDIIHSILCIIGENIGMIATLFAELHKISKIIFCGGLLRDNNIIKNLLKLMVKSRNKSAIFLKNAEFAGAIGSLVS
jgi:type II pantothenate kinase